MRRLMILVVVQGAILAIAAIVFLGISAGYV